MRRGAAQRVPFVSRPVIRPDPGAALPDFRLPDRVLILVLRLA